MMKWFLHALTSSVAVEACLSTVASPEIQFSCEGACKLLHTKKTQLNG